MSRKRGQLNGFDQVSGIDFSEELSELQKGATLVQVKLDDIHIVKEQNPRGRFDKGAFSEEKLRPLAEGIKADGVLTPLWIRKKEEGGYELIAGERRLRAARLAGLDEVPALLMNVSKQQSKRLAVIENAQREQMNVIEESYAGFALMEDHTGLSRADLIAHLNAVRKGREEDIHGLESLLRSTFGSGIQTWAQLRSKLFLLTDAERNAVFEQKIDYSLATLLTRLEEGEKRKTLLERAITEQLSGPQIKALVDAEVGIQKSEWQQSTEAFKKVLPRLSKLQGEKAVQAKGLMDALRELVEGREDD